MPTHTKFEHGDFSWVDLGTTDAEAAKSFYGGLFGWSFQDMPAGPNMTYSFAKVGDAVVGGLYKMGPEMQGIPPNWLSYINVTDVDATTAKVEGNGGKVMKGPFDVMDQGRMSVLQDPSGGTVAFWQSKKFSNPTLKRDPGSMCWNELLTTNVDAAGKFYATTVGWKTEGMDMGPMGTYTIFSRDGSKDTQVAGMMAHPMKGVPSAWIAYFATTDVDASAKKTTELGGKVVTEPMDIPNIGRFAMVQDPQGAVFALFTAPGLRRAS